MQVIVDTREKTGLWEFSDEVTIVERKLDTGDYSVDGLETKLCIERKKSISEWANNITEKRFKNELERMVNYEHRFIILEFNVDDVIQFPVGSSIPRYRWRSLKITPNFILSANARIQVDYNINLIYAGDRDNAMRIAETIMRRVNARYHPS